MAKLLNRLARKHLCWGIYAVGMSLATPIASRAMPEEKSPPVARVADAVVLKVTPNGCTFLLEKLGTDDERLIIVKNGQRNVFPTLKEAEADSGPRMDVIRDVIATAKRDNMKSWFKNGFISTEAVPETQYQWRLKAHSLLAVTIYQMNREAVLTEDSDSTSIYLQRYMVGHARRALNTSLSQAERLQSTIRLVYHGFADLKLEKQERLNGYIEDTHRSPKLIDYNLRTNAFSWAQYYTDQANKGAPKFAVDPEAVGKLTMLDYQGDDNLKDTIKAYKSSNRKGLNNIGKILEIVYHPSVPSSVLNPK